MSNVRVPLLALAFAALACAAQPKSMNTGTDVVEGDPVAAAPEPEATPEPGSCIGDADCAAGERCDAGRCAAAPAVSSCSLVRVQFDFDSSQLTPDAMSALRDNASCIAERQATAVLIEGHCDERGTAEYNVALGSRRAETVRRYLAELGVTASLDSVSFGKEIPLAPGSGETSWSQNRRAELRLPGETRSDGTVVAGR
jgi:peptidoglycan-associated lipoprotein